MTPQQIAEQEAEKAYPVWIMMREKKPGHIGEKDRLQRRIRRFLTTNNMVHTIKVQAKNGARIPLLKMNVQFESETLLTRAEAREVRVRMENSIHAILRANNFDVRDIKIK